MYKLCFFVPMTHLDAVKSALFSVGAGRYKQYDSCCWHTLGQMQFRPLKNSQPFLGQQETIERVEEYKVEMICDDQCIDEAISTLREAHPYEEPAYEAWNVRTL